MKTFFKILSFVILLFSFVIDSFAINAPNNLKIDSTLDSSVNLSWDLTENAFMYYIYYSKQSGLDIGYDMQTEFIETNSIEINDLELGFTYYFVVVAIDENGDESSYSNEVAVDIIDPSNEVSSKIDFALDSVNVIGYNKIELNFTTLLESTEETVREFKIINKADNLDTFEVIEDKLNEEDNSKLELTLDRDLEIGNEYEIVIIAITSNDGKNIESGIDNTDTFLVEEIIVNDDTSPDKSNTVIDDEEISLNAANNSNSVDNNSSNSTSNIPSGPSGANIENSEIENVTLSVSKNNTALPKTGPEHILMLILAIILGSLIFIFKFKKS